MKENNMKAKNIKQHIPKKNQDYMETVNEWGDKDFIVEGVHYKTKEEAKQAIHDLVTKEFNERNKK